MEYTEFTPNTIESVKKSADSISQFLTPLSNLKTCDNETRFIQNIRPGQYQFDDKIDNLSSCYFDHQNMSGGGISIKNDQMVDLESELRGITHINSKCDDQKLKMPSLFKNSSNLEVRPYCSDYLTTEINRQKKGCHSELLVNRFDFPLQPPVINDNSYIGLNTRLYIKKDLEKQI
jgi:hypothetical protein